MKVLFVTSEVASIKKFGGLGDYSASLPKALSKKNVDIDIIFPYYEDANLDGFKVFKSITLEVSFNGETTEVEFYKTKLHNTNVDVILPKMNKSFSGNFISDSEYYAFYNKVVVAYIACQYNIYDIIHCNDWHTGFISHLLEDEFDINKPKTLLTIHNLAYQGISPLEILNEIGFIPGEHPLLDYDSEDNKINMLWQAITSFDYLNTVSPNYAKELQSKKFGGDFAEVIINRNVRFSGILNGIDYDTLPLDFTSKNYKESKSKYKQTLLNQLKVPTPKNTTSEDAIPLFSYISRLDPGQKGLDILYKSIPSIIDKGGQFILLGTGDPLWEGKLKDLQKDPTLKNNISINIKFDVELANLIYKASDFFLVPSKYEPCGLTQMMAMRYGTLPIVHGVGGLKDSVENEVDGFVFNNYDSVHLIQSIDNAFNTYKNNKKMSVMVHNAMKKDFSWNKSAELYLNLYNKLLTK